MSTSVVQHLLNELRVLPDSDRELVIGFLQALKHQPHPGTPSVARHGCNPALSMIDGLFVFTGQIEDSHTDWLQVVRDEREERFVRQALDRTSDQ